jgi:hypothetical protein
MAARHSPEVTEEYLKNLPSFHLLHVFRSVRIYDAKLLAPTQHPAVNLHELPQQWNVLHRLSNDATGTSVFVFYSGQQYRWFAYVIK